MRARNFILMFMIILCAIMAVSMVSSSINNSGMKMLLYPTDSNLVLDLSGNNNTGYFEGNDFSGVYLFDGFDDYIWVNDTPDFNVDEGFSLSFWVRPTQIENWETLIWKGHYNETGSWYLELSNGEYNSTSGALNFYLEETGANFDTLKIDDDSLHHIVIVYDNEWKVYVDNQKRMTIDAGVHNNNENLIIGSYAGESNYFMGDIDEIILWDRSITEDEINEIYEEHEEIENNDVVKIDPVNSLGHQEIQNYISSKLNGSMFYTQAQNAFVYIDDGQGIRNIAFNGTFTNISYNVTRDAYDINTTGNGTFVSEIYDAGFQGEWTSILWNTDMGPLLDQCSNDGHVDMSSNVLLLHMEDGMNAVDNSCVGIPLNIWPGPPINQVPGEFDQGYQFTGNEYIFDNQDPNLALIDFTVSTWFRLPTKGYFSFRTLHSRTNGFNTGYSAYIDTFDQVCFWIAGASQICTSPIVDNNWHNVVTVYDQPGTQARLYLDGVNVVNLSATMGFSPTDWFSVGTMGGSSNFIDEMDELAVFNRAFNTQEVYNLYKRKFGDLEVSYKLCDDANCIGESWMPMEINPSFAIPLNPGYQWFQYKVDFIRHSPPPGLYWMTLGSSTTDPIVQLKFPANNTEDHDGNIGFSCNASSNYNMSNVTLYIYHMNGSHYYNQTATNGFGGSTQNALFSKNNIPEGDYIWTCNGTNSNGVEDVAFNGPWYFGVYTSLSNHSGTFVENGTVTNHNFTTGTFTNTDYLWKDGAIKLNGSGNGSYTSKVFDWGEDYSIDDIFFMVTGGGLIDNRKDYHLINNSRNKIVLHFDGNGSVTSGDELNETSENAQAYYFGGTISYNNTGKIDSSLRMNHALSTNGRIQTNLYLNDAPFTHSIWVKRYFNYINNNPEGIINAGDLATTIQGYQLFFGGTDDKIYFEFGNSTSQALGRVIGPKINDTEWHHYVITHNGTHGFLYVDGVNVGNKSQVVGYNTSKYLYGPTAYYGIRSVNNGLGQYLNAELDEAAAWDYELSEDEIQLLYQNGYTDHTLEIRNCDSSCTNETWEEVNNPVGYWVHPLRQYFQYRVNLSTLNSAYTPKLYNVTLNISKVTDGNSGTFLVTNVTDQYSFLDGQFENITFRNDLKKIVLLPEYTSGSFLSQVFTRPSGYIWKNITWQSGYRELKDEQGSDGNYIYAVNMNNNEVLYHFNENNITNNSIIQDTGSNGTGLYNATFYGDDFNNSVEGKLGKALWIEGEKVEVLTLNEVSKIPMTTAFWMKYHGSVTGLSPLFSDICFPNDMAGQMAYIDPSSGNNVNYMFGNGTVSDGIGSNTLINDAEWHHYAFTYNGTHGFLYIDGVLEGSAEAPMNSSGCNAFGETYTIGYWNDPGFFGQNQSINATFDEYAVWTPGLTSDEIRNLYLRGVGKLNLSIRECDSLVCTSGNWVDIDAKTAPHNLTLGSNYIQYKFDIFENSPAPDIFNVIFGLENITDVNFTYIINETTTKGYGYASGNWPSLTYDTDHFEISSGSTGSFISEIFDLGDNKSLYDFIASDLKQGLPDNGAYANEINMSGNKLLLHMEDVFNQAVNPIIDSAGVKNHVEYRGDNGVYKNATGKIDNGFWFDGSGDQIMIPYVNNQDKTPRNGPLTVAVWLKRNNTGYQTIIDRRYIGNNYGYWAYFDGITNQVRFNSYNVSLVVTISDNGITDNGWHHIVLVNNGTHSYMYIDNVKQSDVDVATIDLKNNNDEIEIGSYESASYFKGWMDEFAIWNRALTQSEINKVYRAGLIYLNYSIKLCDDINCNGEAWIDVDDLPEGYYRKPTKRYVQYKSEFYRNKTWYSPEIYNVSINVKSLTEGNSGLYITNESTITRQSFLDENVTRLIIEDPEDALSMILDEYNGTIISRIFDLGEDKSIINISDISVFGNLPNNKGINPRINMSGNKLLLHMDEEDMIATNVVEIVQVKDDSGETNKPYYRIGDSAYKNSTGKIGGGFWFDGLDDEIIIPDGSVGTYYDDTPRTGPLTVAFWAKRNRTNTVESIIDRRYTSNNYGYWITFDGASTNKLRFITYNASAIATYSDDPITDNEWHHYVCINNGTHNYMYVDGVKQYDVDEATIDMLAYYDDIEICAYEDSSDYKGWLDEFAIWNRTLSEEEVINIYESGLANVDYSIKLCDDANCNGETWIKFEDLPNGYLRRSPERYVQYKAEFTTDNSWYTPRLYNLSLEVVGLDAGNIGTYIINETNTTKYEYLDETLTNLIIDDFKNALTFAEEENNGTLISRVYDFGTEKSIYNISWLSNAGPLADNKGEEIGVDMSNNKLLLHFQDEPMKRYSYERITDSSGENNFVILGSNDDNDKSNTSGKFGNAIEFDGSGDYLKIDPVSGSSIPTKGPLTISLWAKRDTTGVVKDLIDNRYSSQNYGYRIFFSSDNRINFWSYNVSGLGVTSDKIIDNAWHHYAFINNGTHSYMYVDGVKQYDVDEITIDLGIYINNIAYIGIYDGSSNPFDGLMDEIAMWDVALSENEIQNLYQRGLTDINITYRLCNDSNCNGESWNELDDTPSGYLPINPERYIQYKSVFSTDDIGYNPELYNFTIEVLSLNEGKSGTYIIGDSTIRYSFLSGSLVGLFFNDIYDALSAKNGYGNFTSQVFDLGEDKYITDISWKDNAGELSNFGKALYVDMNGNELLLHFEEEIIPDAYGDATIIDSSPNNAFVKYESNDAGIKTNKGIHGNAIYFDGTDDWIRIPEESDPTLDRGEFTFSIWLNATAYEREIFEKRYSSNNYGYRARFTSLGIDFYSMNGTSVLIESDGVLALNTWHHCVFVNNGTHTYLYVNGHKQLDVEPGSMDLRTYSTDFYIGTYDSTSSDFAGQMDEIGLWNRALSEQEIMALYHRGFTDVNYSFRTCNDSNCNGEEWIQYNQDDYNLPLGRYVQYKTDMSQNGQDAYFKNLTIEYETINETGQKIYLNNSGSITEKSFRNGTLENVTYPLSLIGNELTGEYVSEVLDGGTVTRWNSIDFESNYGELDEDIQEINMSGNVLLMHFRENNPAENSIILDYSGYGNDGITQNIAGQNISVTSKIGNGFSFDGVDDYVHVDNSPSLNITSSFTYEAWIRFADPTPRTLNMGIISQYKGSSTYETAFLRSTADGLQGAVRSSGGTYVSTNPIDWIAAPNVWYYVTLVFDDDNNLLSIYVDGSKKVQITTTYSPYAPVGGLDIGRGVYSSTPTITYFKGDIDEPAVYNRALSREEIYERWIRGLKRLNISARTCSGVTCAGVNYTNLQDSPQDLSLNDNRYFQFKVNFIADMLKYLPTLSSFTANFRNLIPPVVTLVAPGNINKKIGTVKYTQFICDVNDTLSSTNVSLYITNSTNQLFSFNQSVNTNGTYDRAEFLLPLSLGSYTWNCKASNQDGYSAFSTSNRTIIYSANTKTTQSNPLFVTELGLNSSREALLCYNQSTSDSDGHEIRNIYNWYLNGSSFAVLNMPFEASGYEPITTRDYSIYQNNGTVNGSTWTETGGYIGGAYVFDGNDYIDAGNDTSFNLSEEVTLSAWVKSNSEGYIIAKDPEDSVSYIFNMGTSSATSDCQPNVQVSWDWNWGACGGTSGLGSNVAHADGNKDRYVYCEWNDTIPAGSEITRIHIDPINLAHYEADGYADWYINDLMLLDNDNLGGVGTSCGSYADYPNPINVTGTNISYYNVSGKNTLYIYKQLGSWYIMEGTNAAINVTVYYSTKYSVPYGISTMNGGEFSIGNNTITSSTDLNDNTWHHIAGSYNGSVMKIYVDGVLENSTNYNGTIPTNTDPVWIGRHWNPGNTSNWFNGTIDEVMIFNKGLSGSQIQAIYNNRTDMITRDETNKFDNWYCSITPNDGAEDGLTKISNNITLGDAAPILSTVLKGAHEGSEQYIDENIVGYWRLNGNTFDETGVNNGTVSGAAPIQEGRVGKAYDFDGTSKIAFTPVSTGNTDGFTVSTWIKAEDSCFVTSTRSGIVGVQSKWFFELVGQGSSANINWYNYEFNSPAWIATSTSISDNDWHHLVVTYDKINTTIYLDGVSQNLIATGRVGSVTPMNNPMEIGNSPGVTRYFNGSIDEVIIWNRSLSAEEVENLYNSTAAINKVNTFMDLACAPNGTFDLEGADVRSIINWYENNKSITVLNMPFEGGSNDSYTKDYSGYGNDGVPYNDLSWSSIAGRDGKGAYDLDGVNDYVRISDQEMLEYEGGNMTLSVWIKPTLGETTNGYLISKPWNGAGRYNYVLNYRSDQKIEITLTGNKTQYIASTTIASRGSWHHIAATFNDQNEVKIYIDGEESQDSNHTIYNWIPTGGGDTNIDLAIGTLYPYGEGWVGNTGFSFNGTIDDVIIYNRTLSEDQIKELYRNNTQIIVNEETLRTEDWYCKAYPADQDGSGASKDSGLITIENVEPTQDTPIMGAHAPTRTNLDENILGYWKLEGNFVDETGNYNGVASSDPEVEYGRIGKGYLLDNNDYIVVPNADEINNITDNQITVSGWVKLDAYTTYGSVAGNSRDCCGSYGGWNLWADRSGNLPYFQIWNNTYAGAGATSALPLNEWHMITGTYDGSTIKIYIDGQLNNTQAWTTGMGKNVDFNLNLGNLGVPVATNSLEGSLDEVIIWNKALSADEIEFLYNTTAGNVTYTLNDLACAVNNSYDFENDEIVPIINWYKDSSSITLLNLPFEGGSNSTLTQDYSGNNNDGAVTSATWSETGGYIGGAYQYDGVDDVVYVSSSNSLELNDTSFTITYWMNSPMTAGNQGLFQKGVGSFNGNGRGIEIRSQGTTLEAAIGNGTGTASRLQKTSMPQNQWAFIALTHDQTDGTTKLYVDNSLADTQTYTGGYVDNYGIRIGRGHDGYFNGTIDEVKIFNTALNEEQLTEIYENRTQVLSDLTGKHEEWYCAVTLTDPFDFTTTKLSPTIFIDNYIPTHDTPSIGSHYSDEGIVGSWRFERGAVDETGVNNGTITGATLLDQGKVGKAYSFDGNDYIEIPSSSSLGVGDNGTIALWVKLNEWDPDVDNQFVNNNITYNSADALYLSQHYSVGLHYRYGGTNPGNKYLNYAGSNSWTDGSWHYVVIVWNRNATATNLYLYADGQQVDSDSTSLRLNLTSAEWNFGKYLVATHQEYLDGSLDEITMWNKALNSTEIGKIYNSSIGLYANNKGDLVCTLNNTYDYDDTPRAIYNWNRNGESFTKVNMPFDGSDGTSTKNYGSGNNGTVTGANYQGTSGYNQGGYYFDGNDGISISELNFMNGTNAWTVSMWVYPTALAGNTVGIWSKTAGWSNTMHVVSHDTCVVGNCKWEINYMANGAFLSSSNIEKNNWQHVTITFDGNEDLRLFINGTEDANSPFNTSTVSVWPGTTGNFNIGASGAYGTAYHTGYIDEVNVFDRALSEEQIQMIYSNRTYEISNSELSRDENWSCSLTPNDNFEDGTTKTTGIVTIDDVYYYTIQNLPNNTKTVLATDTTIHVNQVGQQGIKEVLLGENVTNGSFAASVWIDFNTNPDFSTLVIETDRTNAKSVLHNSNYVNEIINRSLLIPIVQNTSQFYVCPNAQNLSEVEPNCSGIIKYNLGETHNGMASGVRTLDNESYYVVYNIYGTGGGEGNPPSLINASLVPTSGTTDTNFNYSVFYFDAENDTAQWVYVNIDGTNYTMLPTNALDNDVTDGKGYYYITKLTVGSHNYTFLAADQANVTANTSLFLGPNVSISYGNSGTIISDGITTTRYNFTEGTYNNTEFNDTADAVDLNASDNGSWISNPYTTGAVVSWETFTEVDKLDYLQFLDGKDDDSTNLRVLFHLDDPIFAPTIFDSSGNGLNGTVLGVPTFNLTGRINKSLEFGGIIDYITVIDGPNYGTNYTLATWVKLNDTTDINIIVGADGQNDPVNLFWSHQLRLDPGGYFQHYYDNGGLPGGLIVTGTTQPIANQWYHVVGVYDGFTIKLYVNGQQEGSGVVGFQTVAVDRFFIGSQANSGFPLNGTLDEVLIFNRSLSDDEILNLYERSNIKYQIKTCNDLTCIGDYNDPSLLGNIYRYIPINRYVKYYFNLTSNNFTFNPQVNNVTITYASLSANGSGTYFGNTTSNLTYYDFFGGSWENATYWEFQEVYTLTRPNTKGMYESEVFSMPTKATWDNISWVSNDEFPDNSRYEIDVNMSTNGFLYHMNEPIGTNVIDTSGNGNNATAFGGVTYNVSGIFKKGYNFDGINDYVNITSAPSIAPGPTGQAISMWIKAPPGTTTRTLISRGNAFFPPYWSIELAPIGAPTPGAVNINLGGANNFDTLAIDDGKWHHVFVQEDAINNWQLYIDGKNRNILANGPVANFANLYIGAFDFNGAGGMTNFYNGTIDEVAYWGKNFLPNEIADMYARGITRFNFSARTCNDSVCTGVNYTNIGTESPLTMSLSKGAYFQYKYEFNTSNESLPPKLRNVTILNSPQPQSIQLMNRVATTNILFNLNGSVTDRRFVTYTSTQNESIESSLNQYNQTLTNFSVVSCNATSDRDYYTDIWANTTLVSGLQGKVRLATSPIQVDDNNTLFDFLEFTVSTGKYGQDNYNPPNASSCAGRMVMEGINDTAHSATFNNNKYKTDIILQAGNWYTIPYSNASLTFTNDWQGTSTTQNEILLSTQISAGYPAFNQSKTYLINLIGSTKLMSGLTAEEYIVPNSISVSSATGNPGIGKEINVSFLVNNSGTNSNKTLLMISVSPRDNITAIITNRTINASQNVNIFLTQAGMRLLTGDATANYSNTSQAMVEFNNGLRTGEVVNVTVTIKTGDCVQYGGNKKWYYYIFPVIGRFDSVSKNWNSERPDSWNNIKVYSDCSDGGNLQFGTSTFETELYDERRDPVNMELFFDEKEYPKLEKEVMEKDEYEFELDEEKYDLEIKEVNKDSIVVSLEGSEVEIEKGSYQNYYLTKGKMLNVEYKKEKLGLGEVELEVMDGPNYVYIYDLVKKKVTTEESGYEVDYSKLLWLIAGVCFVLFIFMLVLYNKRIRGMTEGIRLKDMKYKMKSKMIDLQNKMNVTRSENDLVVKNKKDLEKLEKILERKEGLLMIKPGKYKNEVKKIAKKCSITDMGDVLLIRT